MNAAEAVKKKKLSVDRIREKAVDIELRIVYGILQF
jgi:hypothetical protein